jgi:hypothetical protein
MSYRSHNSLSYYDTQVRRPDLAQPRREHVSPKATRGLYGGGYDIVRHNSPGPPIKIIGGLSRSSIRCAPGRTCDVLGDGEQYEWYVNLLLQDVDGALEIVAEASHLA